MHAELSAAPAEGAGATDPQTERGDPDLRAIAAPAAFGGVLPDDRADVLYHRYEGGGVTIHGPSVLVRKKIRREVRRFGATTTSTWSRAPRSTWSSLPAPIKKSARRRAWRSTILRGKSTYSAGIINSKESDYTADTSFFSISQDMFGDLTTVTLTYKRGWNDIFRNVKQPEGGSIRDPGFAQVSDTRGYALGLTQILTRNLILAMNYEVLTDEGFLNSPYRSVRFVDPTAATGFSFESEIYPRTHTSNAFSTRLRYYLPYRAAVDGQYRFFSDTWGVNAHTVELGYTHPAWKRWVFDAKFRYYRQTAADFYSDLFPRRQFANFLARDKELSTFSSYTAGIGASYEFTVSRFPSIQKGTANFRWDHLMIDYQDFRDATAVDPGNGVVAGSEPLYQLDADVLQLFVSIWF